MKLRYEIRNSDYIPQYFHNEQWYDFKVRNVKGELKNICQQIGFLQNNFGRSQWYYIQNGNDLKNGVGLEEMIVFFTKEIYVNAFLGAAQYHFKEKYVNFEL